MPKFYDKPHDDKILEEVVAVLEARPSYGYKRITAMINTSREQLSQKRLNKKRILRIMQKNGLMLPKMTSEREHKGTGKIATLHSNTRWCSDCFEIVCFNREKVFVGFALDTCDREILNFVVSKSPITAKDIQGLMLGCVENRFSGAQKAPRVIQWLSDRGAVYRAHETQRIAKQLSLASCFTSAYSPESNGMAEAFVRTIKRDYVYTSDCKDPEAVIEMLPKWIEDYNENAPHSALGMVSPSVYRSKNS